MAVILLLSVNAFFLEVEIVNSISLQNYNILLDDGVKMSHFVYWQITKKNFETFFAYFLVQNSLLPGVEEVLGDRGGLCELYLCVRDFI